MDDDRIDDDDLLRRMRLSAGELDDLLQKLNGFFNSLNDEQRRAYRNSQQSLHKAAEELGDDVDAEDLEKFLRKHAPPGGIICVVCSHHGGGGVL